jgi:GMP synthase (glutamine-hydrolysing)
MAIIILQHHDTCPPGRIGQTLRDHGLRSRILRPDRGEALPTDLDDVDAVVSMGGPQQVDEGHAWIKQELAFLKMAHEASLPVLGVCLGHQLLAEALGGKAGPADELEIGFVDVNIAPAGQTDIILRGIPWTSPMFQKHTYEVKELPPGAQTLASSDRCGIQIYRVGMRTYGFQYHFEADRALIERLTSDAATSLHRMGLTSDEWQTQLNDHYVRFARIADRLCLNIVTYMIPRIANAMRL